MQSLYGFPVALAILTGSVGLAAISPQQPPAATGKTAAKSPGKATPSAQKSAAKRNAPAAKPSAKPAPAPEPPYPPIPDLPTSLTLAGTSPLANGDSWTYLVTSSDPQLDGKLLTLTLKQRSSDKFEFNLQLGDVTRSVTVLWPGGAGWFTPAEDSSGALTVKLFANRGSQSSAGDDSNKDIREVNRISVELPLKVEAGRFSNFNVSGSRRGIIRGGQVVGWVEDTPGWNLEFSGPEMCVVPATALACARFAYAGPDTRIIAHFEPDSQAALRARLSPPGGRRSLLLELYSSAIGGTPRSSVFPELAPTERQKAAEWIKANAAPSQGYDPAVSFLSLLHEKARLHPRDTVRIFMTPGITRDGKAYVAEWKARKFSVREMTADELAKEPRQQTMYANVVLRQ